MLRSQDGLDVPQNTGLTAGLTAPYPETSMLKPLVGLDTPPNTDRLLWRFYRVDEIRMAGRAGKSIGYRVFVGRTSNSAFPEI